MLVQAVKTDVGSGKTEINLQNMAIRLRQMRDSGDKRICVVAVPTHALGDQQMTRFRAMLNAKNISAGVWRSREANANGEPMCLDRGAVKEPRKHSPMSRPRYAGEKCRMAQLGNASTSLSVDSKNNATPNPTSCSSHTKSSTAKNPPVSANQHSS
jgi:hypothetical protein